MNQTIMIGKEKKSTFMDKVRGILPDQGNLNLCLTCGACSSGCPATGLEDMDPRKFLRMAALGLDEEITEHPWVWMCTMCGRCNLVCPSGINIADMVPHSRETHAAARPARYALEVNRGWFAKRGIVPGARIEGIEKAPSAR